MDFDSQDITGYLTGSTGMFDIGEIIGGNYEVVEMLGEGAHAEVYKVYNKSDENYYVTKVPKDGNSSMQFQREVRILNALSKIRTPSTLVHPHPSIKHAGEPVLILEYLEGPTLQEYIKEKPEGIPKSETKRIIRDILLALKCLHEAGIVHCDVKPENIKYNNGRAILFDFSVAQKLPYMITKTCHSGTVEYMPPDKQMSCAWDVFSVGVLLHLLLRGRFPLWDRGHLRPADQSDQLLLPRKLEKDLALNGVLLRALSYTPHNRFKDASAMLLWLRWYPSPVSYLFILKDNVKHYPLRSVFACLLIALAIMQTTETITQAIQPSAEEVTQHADDQYFLNMIGDQYRLNHYAQIDAVKSRIEHTDINSDTTALTTGLVIAKDRKDLLTHSSKIKIGFSKLTIQSENNYHSFTVRITFNQLANGASDSFKTTPFTGNRYDSYVWRPHHHQYILGIKNNSSGKIYVEASTDEPGGSKLEISYAFGGPHDLHPTDGNGWIEWPEHGIKLRIEADYHHMR